MKLNVQEVKHNIGNVQQFNIQASAKAFQILSDNLYSNKIEAVIRELVCNAVDAHKAAGNSKPVQVILPTALHPSFDVIDNGTGLSPENIKKLYTTYFASDKSDTNDMIGGLGLGSKSPFAYTKSFTVSSRWNGVEYQYLAFLGDGGVPSISLLSERKTDEPNGMTVSVPVLEGDMYQFEREVSVKLRAFGDEEVKVIRGKEEYKRSIIDVEELNEKGYTTGKTYHGDEVCVVMGNVCYPVNYRFYRNIKGSLGLDIAETLYIKAEIGSLEITPSRESLSLTPDTEANLNKLVEGVFNKIREEIDGKLKTERTGDVFIWFTNRVRVGINETVSVVDKKFITPNPNPNQYDNGVMFVHFSLKSNDAVKTSRKSLNDNYSMFNWLWWQSREDRKTVIVIDGEKLRHKKALMKGLMKDCDVDVFALSSEHKARLTQDFFDVGLPSNHKVLTLEEAQEIAKQNREPVVKKERKATEDCIINLHGGFSRNIDIDPPAENEKFVVCSIYDARDFEEAYEWPEPNTVLVFCNLNMKRRLDKAGIQYITEPEYDSSTLVPTLLSSITKCFKNEHHMREKLKLELSRGWYFRLNNRRHVMLRYQGISDMMVDTMLKGLAIDVKGQYNVDGYKGKDIASTLLNNYITRDMMIGAMNELFKDPILALLNSESDQDNVNTVLKLFNERK